MNVMLCTGVVIVGPCWSSLVIALQSNSCSTGICPYCWVVPIPRSLLYHPLSRWWALKRLCHKETQHCGRNDVVGKLLRPVDNCIYSLVIIPPANKIIAVQLCLLCFSSYVCLEQQFYPTDVNLTVHFNLFSSSVANYLYSIKTKIQINPTLF